MISRKLIQSLSKTSYLETPSPREIPLREQFRHGELPEVRAELLDTQGWAEILQNFASGMRLAVALTDTQGRLLGACHNPQPVWQLARHSTLPSCPFCLAPTLPCRAVMESLDTGRVVIAHDRAGLAHLAVPLSLDEQKLGALIAGQVFDRYPELLPVQKVARIADVSPTQLWTHAVQQAPISRGTLSVYGDLLASLGNAYLRQRYSVILNRKLAETDRRYRVLVEGARDHGLFTIDRYGRITSWNAGAEHLYCYKEREVLGSDYSMFFTAEDIQAGKPAKLLEDAAAGGSAQDEGWQVRSDGTSFFTSGILTSLGLESGEFGRLVRDVTERRKTEAALLQAHKMESIGVLAGGIAHDFNNLLTGILFSVTMAKNTMPVNESAYSMLELAEQSTEKAAALTNQLLAYAGKGKFVISHINFSALISEMLSLITTSIPKHVKLQLSLPFNLPLIEADASQIQQVIMNLAINGAEAIGPEGGILRVSTGVTGVGAGRSVYMEIQDSGCGMTEATKAKIFDPFFTTKFSGRGLGLAAVSGIVRGHNGKMEVDSVVGEGTTFRVSFPALETPVLQVAEIPPPPAIPGEGLVLFVDDEPALRTLAKAGLERSGFSVMLAGDGREAVDVFRQHADQISAVVLDLTMPLMDGKEACRQIREIRPDVPIIISTGYSEYFANEQGFGSEVGFLQKPYTPARLSEKLSSLIPSQSRS